MHRERLRSQKGCLVCRQRRKKCDEQKPKCAQCTRLRLVCKWDDDGTHHLGDNLKIERIVSVQSDRAVHSHMNTVSGRLRVADHDEINRDNMELPTGIVDVMSQRYTTTQTTKTEDYHLLITGIFKGWDQISKEIRSSDPWFKIILFDHQLQRSGQGLVARLAMSFNSIAMYQYLSAFDSRSEQVNLSLPAWYLPKQTSAREGPNSLTNYPVWPGVRELFATEPEKYINDRFINTFVSYGIRFLWPYGALSAITISKSTGLACFSDEFILRANNLRSYAATADFLNKYPEFRSSMSQLEPSPTFYRPESAEYLEALYWSILREKTRHARSVEGNSAPKSESRPVIKTQLSIEASSSSEGESSSAGSPTQRSTAVD